MKLFLIPGLGYDQRIFSKLDINPNPSYLTWLEPRPEETIADYALRMAEDIEDSNTEEIVLIGHSLGGVVAQEIAQHMKIKKIVLISSIKNPAELPNSFQWIRKLHLYRFFSKEISIRTVQYWGAAHGFSTNHDQELFKGMISKVSNNYLKWALKVLVTWKGCKFKPETQLVHIHGTMDKTLTLNKNMNPDYIIQRGSHIMVYKMANRISEILKKELTFK